MENHQNPTPVTPRAYLEPTAPEHWRVLLAEFVHLLGLLLIHSRHAQSVRATSVLFDQLMRHLSVLEKMPDHEGAMMLSCGVSDKGAQDEAVQYRIIFGNMVLQRSSLEQEQSPIGGKHAAYLNNALDQTFGYLLKSGIESLYLQLPGDSKERLDQLRLALNIIARIQDAVENKGAVTFHYGDRALAIPMMYKLEGQPDFNLTLLAGINGLSAANADELIKQAKAFHDLALAANVGGTQPYKVVKESYDQIFKVRSLRSQIIKPLVEVNNIPWVGVQTADEGHPVEGAGPDDGISSEEITRAKSLTLYVNADVDHFSAATATRQYLDGYLSDGDSQVDQDLDLVIVDDYSDSNTQMLGERLVATSRLLHCIDKKSQDPAVGDRLLYFLQMGLQQVNDQVLANIEVQNQGLRFFVQGRAMVVGLVHPRLVDMTTMVKDQVITRHKVAVIRKVAFNFDHRYADVMADIFDISDENAHKVLDLLKSCFDAEGCFDRDAFESRIDGMVQLANTSFEVNWSFLRETPHRRDRLALLNAIQLPMSRLEDPTRALRFLLDDLCDHTDRVDYTDRNALVLGNILIQAKNKTLHVDLEQTPETILGDTQEIDGPVHRYALWRINTDQIRIVGKLKTIHHALEQALRLATDDNHLPINFLLALEREALIFMALVNGPTARRILTGLIKLYGDPQTDIYTYASERGLLSQIIAQLQIVIRCMGCVGYAENIPLLQAVVGNTDKILSLDSHPVYAVQVTQTMKWVPKAIKKIQVNSS